MSARVTAAIGPARSGKTARMLARYRDTLANRPPGSTLWIAPTWRAAVAVRERLLDGELPGCFSPGVTTFDQFAESVLQASPVAVRPLSRLMKRHLVRQLIDREHEAGRLRYFHAIARTAGLVDLVCDFIRELKRLEIWPEQFGQACARCGMSQKDSELLSIYEAYQRSLTEHQLYDAEGRFWSARTQLDEGQRRPFERVRLVVVDGFTDFTPPQHEILTILGRWVEELFITLPLDSDPARSDLFYKTRSTLLKLKKSHPDLNEQTVPRPETPDWPAMAELEANLFVNPRVSPAGSATEGLEILAASRQLGEIELIGARIKRLLTTVAADRIAVVMRSPDEQGDLIREVFGRLGIPVALESAPTLARSSVLAMLVRLIRLDAEDWPARDLLAVLNNTHFEPGWPGWETQETRTAMDRTIRRLQVPRGRARLLEQLQRAAAARPDDSEPSTFDEAAVQRKRHEADATLAVLRRLAGAFDGLPDRATLGEWADAWSNLARQFGLLLPHDPDDIEEDSSKASPPGLIPDRIAWRRLQEALRSSAKLSDWLEEAEPELDRDEALTALVDTLASVTVNETTDESGRVRILSAAGVRSLEIPHLFFAGLSEQAFPPPERQDRLYGDAEYHRLVEAGLPLVTRTERNREEMLLFYEVMTRASKRLCFSYPALDETAQPLSPSPYLEEVQQALAPAEIPRTVVADLSPVPTDDDPLTDAQFRIRALARALEGDRALLSGLIQREPEIGLAENLLASLRMAELRQDRDRFGPAEGILVGSLAREELALRYGPAHTFSATELERYASCPFRFFLERLLKIEPPEDAALDVDYLARGRLVHDCLAAFHERVNREQGEPTSPAALDEETYARLMAEVVAELSPETDVGTVQAALAEIDRRLWAEWSQNYREQHERYDSLWGDCDEPLVPSWFEVSFGRQDEENDLSTDRALELRIDDQTVRISGRIDRMDTGTVGGLPVFNIIDYKTGRSKRLTPESVARGITLQLPLYAIAAEELLLVEHGAVAWQAGYWNVKQDGFKPRQAMVFAAAEAGRIAPTPEWEALRPQLMQVVGSLADSIRSARFPVASADEDCTGNCPFSTTCRINQIRSMEKTWHPLPTED